MDVLNQYIKAVVDDEISKTAIIKRIKGTVIAIVDDTKVRIRLNSPDPVSLPKTVSINNTTGMVVDVGNVVWVYYWKNINDGFILPACMAVKAGVGEFINEEHNSERFNDYSDGAGIFVEEGAGLDNSFVTLRGKGNKIKGLTGVGDSYTGEIFDTELSGLRNTISLGLEYGTDLSPLGDPACYSNYIEGFENSICGNIVNYNYIIGYSNKLGSYWRRIDGALIMEGGCSHNYIFGASNGIDGERASGMTVCGMHNGIVNDLYDIYLSPSTPDSSCDVFGSDNHVYLQAHYDDETDTYIDPIISVYGRYSIFGSGSEISWPQTYGHQTLINGIINRSVAHPDEIKLAIGIDYVTANMVNGMELNYQGDLTVMGSISSNAGADYAEYEEWQDGNENEEDRRGLFVVEVGNMIRLATEGDEPEDVLGIVSSTPTVCGDARSQCWKGAFLKDVFGSPIVDEQPIKDKDGNVVSVKKIPKINPEYDCEKTYQNRAHRKEFTPVAYVGKVVAVDDGTCEVNGYCKPSAGGVATKSDTITRFRVRKRIDETHILVRAL